MFVLLCLAYFTSVMSSRFIHALACVRISFLFKFKLNNIPLYDYTTLCLSIHQLMDIWVLSIFLAVVNNASLNMERKCLFKSCFQFF